MKKLILILLLFACQKNDKPEVSIQNLNYSYKLGMVDISYNIYVNMPCSLYVKYQIKYVIKHTDTIYKDTIIQDFGNHYKIYKDTLINEYILNDKYKILYLKLCNSDIL